MSKFGKFWLKIISFILIVCWAFISAFFIFDFVERNFLYPIKYEQEIINYSDKYGLDRALVFAMVRVESSFNLNAKSEKGAVGLMQITSQTAEYIANLTGVNEYNLTSAKDNLNFGCYYIKYLINRFGILDTALCAYNAGEGNVSKWLDDKNYSDGDGNLTKIPFKETESYVKKVNDNIEIYKKLYYKNNEGVTENE